MKLGPAMRYLMNHSPVSHRLSLHREAPRMRSPCITDASAAANNVGLGKKRLQGPWISFLKVWVNEVNGRGCAPWNPEDQGREDGLFVGTFIEQEFPRHPLCPGH